MRPLIWITQNLLTCITRVPCIGTIVLSSTNIINKNFKFTHEMLSFSAQTHKKITENKCFYKNLIKHRAAAAAWKSYDILGPFCLHFMKHRGIRCIQEENILLQMEGHAEWPIKLKTYCAISVRRGGIVVAPVACMVQDGNRYLLQLPRFAKKVPRMTKIQAKCYWNA